MKKTLKMKCKICGKKLTNPISILLEIGPVCRMNRKLEEFNLKEGNMFGNRAKYYWWITNSVLCIKDIGKNCRSVTNDIENVLKEIANEMGSKRFMGMIAYIYQDSEGVWDEVRFDTEVSFDFADKEAEASEENIHINRLTFHSIGEKDVHEALKKLLK